MLARVYLSTLGRFSSADVGADMAADLPLSWNRYTYVRDTPINAIDSDGREGFLVNRALAIFGGAAQPATNPITHTFVVVVNVDGIHTYSWGNTADPKNEGVAGKWFKDESEDLAAAGAALIQGVAQRVGGDDLDPYIAAAFNKHANKEDDPSNHFNGWVCNNCKSEARKLVKEAKDDKAHNGDKNKTQEKSKTSSSYDAHDVVEQQFMAQRFCECP
jgi:hypothetical protein